MLASNSITTTSTTTITMTITMTITDTITTTLTTTITIAVTTTSTTTSTATSATVEYVDEPRVAQQLEVDGGVGCVVRLGLGDGGRGDGAGGVDHRVEPAQQQLRFANHL